MDLKVLLEQTGYKVKENRFLNAPALPYIVFDDYQVHRGADSGRSMIVEHEFAVELYVKNIENKDVMRNVEDILDALSVDYTRVIEWMDEEKHFKVGYGFDYYEKKLKGGKAYVR